MNNQISNSIIKNSGFSSWNLLCFYTKKIAKEKGFKKSRSFFCRSLMCLPHSLKWLKFIDQFYKENGFELAPSFLITLPIRSYVNSKLSVKARIDLMTNHYKNLANFLNRQLLNKLLTGSEIELSKLTSKNGEIFTINIAILERNSREGGLTIFMSDNQANKVTTITFNIGKDEKGDNFIIIGGLQGTVLGKEKIVNMTRMLNGLRPKYAVLEALYAFADIFKVKSFIATSIKNHVFTKTKLIKQIYSDYDQFWLEVGGIKTKDGNLKMPQSLPKRTLEEVPSKKKKDWLKRQEFLQNISQDINSIKLKDIKQPHFN